MGQVAKFQMLRNQLKSGQVAKAMAELSLLSNSASHDPEYLTVLAEALTRLNQNEALLKVLMKRAQLTEKLEHFFPALELMYKMGQLNEALDVALFIEEKAAQPEQREILAHTFLKLYIELNDFEGLQETLYSYVDVLEYSDFACWAQGVLHLSQDQSDLALECFRKAVQLNSSNEQAWVSLGLLHLERADVALALSNFERALDINPKNETALKNASRLVVPYTAVAVRVLELIQSYLSDHPEDLDMRRHRIHILQMHEKKQEAVLEHKHLQFMTQLSVARSA